MTGHRPHRVVVLLLEPLIGYDAVIPAQLLGEAKDADGRPLYDVTMASLDGSRIFIDATPPMITGGLRSHA